MKKLTNDQLTRIFVGICFLLLMAIAMIWANSGWDRYEITESSGVEYETAKVLAVLEDNAVPDPTFEDLRVGHVKLLLQLKTGRYAGRTQEVTNPMSYRFNWDVKKGDLVSVRVITSGVNEFSVDIYNYNRIPVVIGLVALFFLAMVIVGGWQGFRAFLSLAFTLVCILFLLLPLVLRGWPAVPVTIAIVALTSTVGYYLLGGWQPKTVGSILGCLCGVAGAAFFGWIATSLLHISAYQMDEGENLWMIRQDLDLRFKLSGLLLSSILIAAEGAVMDTAMSVASAMAELKEKRRDISRRELALSGMRIGKDTIGTMANTLVLAFTGSTLNMMLLMYYEDVSFIQLLNTDFMAVELTQGVAGSMGIILTVPCVAMITAWLLTKKGKNN